jgi:hypothetical protein
MCVPSFFLGQMQTNRLVAENQIPTDLQILFPPSRLNANGNNPSQNPSTLLALVKCDPVVLTEENVMQSVQVQSLPANQSPSYDFYRSLKEVFAPLLLK